MTEQEALQTALQASQQRERIAVATALAMFIAGVILVTAILPAEYGVDPVGTGELFGLTRIAQAAGESGEGVAATAAPQELEPVRPGANTSQAESFRRHARTFKLGPYEGVEFKYQMTKGGSMLYSWKASSKVRFDFHGEPEGSPKGYAESYEMGEKETASGSFFAPTSGIHGWWWENLGADDVTVTLTSAGFYSSGVEFRAEGRTDVKLEDE